MTESALHHQWTLQKEAQLSIRARKLLHLIASGCVRPIANSLIISDAPAKLKRELDTILSLQGDLESVEKAINVAKSALASASSAMPEGSKQILKGLLETHATFTSRWRPYMFCSTFMTRTLT